MLLFSNCFARAHSAISHCSHLLLKCRVATNICHWLKAQSLNWFKKYILAKKCILIIFWIFQYCFYYSFTLDYCAIFYSLDAGFFQYHQGVKQFIKVVYLKVYPHFLYHNPKYISFRTWLTHYHNFKITTLFKPSFRLSCHQRRYCYM